MSIKKILLGVSTSVIMLGTIAITSAYAATTCTPTGFYRDGTNMTAAKINPTYPVTGVINATSCNIAVYFGPGHNGTVNNATISGSNYYGVVVQRANVTVTNSNINTIGDKPPDGDQHGVGIYYATVGGVINGDCTTGSTVGSILNNKLSVYQKGGIVADCTGTNVTIANNTITGQGTVNYIAQNGIEVGLGAKAIVTGNKVIGNSYSGSGQASSGGILVYGGPCPPYGGNYTTGTIIDGNTLIGNDVGVYLSNLDASCNATNSNTNITVNGNTISNDSLNNTTGNGPTQGYQAAVSVQGDHHSIVGNTISGAGYNPKNSSASIFTNWIDVSSTNNPLVFGNSFH